MRSTRPREQCNVQSRSSTPLTNFTMPRPPKLFENRALYFEAKNEGTLLVTKTPQAPNSVEDGPRCFIQQRVAPSTHQQWGLIGVSHFLSASLADRVILTKLHLMLQGSDTPSLIHAGVNYGSAPGWHIRFSHCVTRQTWLTTARC